MGIKRTKGYYEQIYKEYETSGKSVKDFCKSINLPLSTFYRHFYRHRECKMEKANNHLIDITEILSPNNLDKNISISISDCLITVSQNTNFDLLRMVIKELKKI